MGGPIRSSISGYVVDPESAMGAVLVSFPVAVIKYPDKNNLREERGERMILNCSSRELQSIKVGKMWNRRWACMSVNAWGRGFILHSYPGSRV